MEFIHYILKTGKNTAHIRKLYLLWINLSQGITETREHWKVVFF